MLPSLQSIQCLKVKVCKNSNQIAKCLIDKIINIDLRSLLLTKPLSQVVILTYKSTIVHSISFYIACYWRYCKS